MPRKKAEEQKAETKKRSKQPKQPRSYTDADELETAVDAYFAKCDEEGTLYSDAGLALALDISMCTLERWRKGEARTEFQYVIQRAFLRMTEQLHTHPAYFQKGMVSMAVFKMKQEKFGGYQDRIEAKQDIAVNVKMGAGMDESDFK